MVSDITLDSRFAALGVAPRRIWVVGAIHGEAERLMDLHDRIYRHIRPGDRIVYCGNYTGYGPSACETIDEVLTFRRGVLSQPGMVAADIVYLRGGQEEMWEKLQQLQFAPKPGDVLNWMLDNGLDATLEDYGLRPDDGLNAAHDGVMALTRWTAAVRQAVRRYPGHDIFQCQLRHAAFTAVESSAPLLFVHAGISKGRTLQDQGDLLWWGGHDFHAGETLCPPFKKIIRGYDPQRKGFHIENHVATVDGGCGFGGALVAAAFDQTGDILGMIEA